MAVPEHAREVRFYAEVLTTGSAPLWRDDLTNDVGTPVIGLGERVPAYEGLPLQWMPHIQVRDVAVSAARAVALGGTERMHGKNDDGESQWAVLVDPGGAAFGVVPVVESDSGTTAPPEGKGRIAGLTLPTADVARACAFYEGVVGWSAAAARTDGDVELRRPDGGSSAAIRPAGDDGLPAVWMLSLPVGDLGESLRRVVANGGHVLQHSSEAGQAIVRDPVGLYVALEEAP